MPRDPISISVVIPVYNSAAIFPVFYDRLCKALESITPAYSCIFVDDGSADNSWEIISAQAQTDAHCTALGTLKNCGQHAAILAGLMHCTSDLIVVMDDDLQDAPEDIPALYHMIMEGYDAVMCRRKGMQASFMRRMASSIFYLALSMISRVRMLPGTTNFGMYNKRVIDDMLKKTNGYFFLPLSVRRFSKQSGTLHVAHHARHSGVSQYSLRTALQLAVNVFRGSLRLRSGKGMDIFTVDRSVGI